MTENQNHQNTKQMLAGSSLKLTNPDFDQLVMNRIEAEAAKSVYLRKGLYYFLAALTIEAIIFLWLRSVSLPGMVTTVSALPRMVQETTGALGNWILKYQFLLLPFLVLLTIRKIIESRNQSLKSEV